MITQTKALIPNHCWLVETDGKKIGTLYREVQGFSFYSGGNKIMLDNSLRVNQHLKLEITDLIKSIDNPVTSNTVHDYPTLSTPFNPLYIIQKKLPVYTNTVKSKCKICAGFYLINEDNKWQKYFCPKLIKLNRHQYHGPFKTEIEMLQKLQTISHETY